MSQQYPPTVFVIGTERNIGKTVTCMGIISKLLSPEHGYQLQEIGYIKPVGQQTLTVTNGKGTSIQADKDAVLLTSLLGIECCGYENMSPIVWRDGLTANFIDEAAQGDPRQGREAFLERIRQAYQIVAQGKRIVIVEGTGQPGVGSVAGISNGDVVNALRAMGVQVFVILVAQGGIGSSIDQIFPFLMALDHLQTRVDGVIINGVIPSKMDKVRHYLETYYDSVFDALYGNLLNVQPHTRLLGFVPVIPELRLPTMRLIIEEFAKQKDTELELIVPRKVEEARNLVRKVKVISLEFGYESFLSPGDAVVVGVNANDAILSMLLLHERFVRKYGIGLSGLILSCKHVGGLTQQIRDMIQSGDLTTLQLSHDSAEILQRVEGMTVKIQPYDTAKKDLIAHAYEKHLTLPAEWHGHA